MVKAVITLKLLQYFCSQVQPIEAVITLKLLQYFCSQVQPIEAVITLLQGSHLIIW